MKGQAKDGRQWKKNGRVGRLSKAFSFGVHAGQDGVTGHMHTQLAGSALRCECATRWLAYGGCDMVALLQRVSCRRRPWFVWCSSHQAALDVDDKPAMQAVGTRCRQVSVVRNNAAASASSAGLAPRQPLVGGGTHHRCMNCSPAGSAHRSCPVFPAPSVQQRTCGTAQCSEGSKQTAKLCTHR